MNRVTQPISMNVHEQRLCEKYVSTKTGGSVYSLRSGLRKLFYEYSSLNAGESVILRSRDTKWIKQWGEEYCHGAEMRRRSRLNMLRGMMAFLYKKNEITDNIYEMLRSAMPHDKQFICFPETGFSIQRQFDLWQRDTCKHGESYWAFRRVSVLKYSVFCGKYYPDSWGLLESIHAWIIDLQELIDWNTARMSARALDNFLNYLCEKGKFDRNPLDDLHNEFPKYGFSGIVKALSEKRSFVLLENFRKDRFRSYLAHEFENYLKHVRATGRVYDYEQIILRKLDNYIADGDFTLTSQSINQWLLTLSHLHSTTQNHYYNQARSFLKYLARTTHSTPVLHKEFAPVPTPLKIPHILTVSEVSILINSVDTIHEPPKCPARKTMYRAMIVLLYCCGLRLGEVLRLDIGDVDTVNGVLTIRNSKFHKTRLVPMSEQVTKEIVQCIKIKDNLGLSIENDAPLFSSCRKRRYFKNSVQHVIKKLMIDTEIRNETRLVRIHDLRHTFAVHRLITWYKNGDDVQAKLPILSQYMGHVDIYHTKHYLTMIPELAEAAMDRFHDYAVKPRRICDEN